MKRSRTYASSKLLWSSSWLSRRDFSELILLSRGGLRFVDLRGVYLFSYIDKIVTVLISCLFTVTIDVFFDGPHSLPCRSSLWTTGMLVLNIVDFPWVASLAITGSRLWVDECIVIGQTLEMARSQLGESGSFTPRLDLLCLSESLWLTFLKLLRVLVLWWVLEISMRSLSSSIS